MTEPRTPVVASTLTGRIGTLLTTEPPATVKQSSYSCKLAVGDISRPTQAALLGAHLILLAVNIAVLGSGTVANRVPSSRGTAYGSVKRASWNYVFVPSPVFERLPLVGSMTFAELCLFLHGAFILLKYVLLAPTVEERLVAVRGAGIQFAKVRRIGLYPLGAAWESTRFVDHSAIASIALTEGYNRNAVVYYLGVSLWGADGNDDGCFSRSTLSQTSCLGDSAQTSKKGGEEMVGKKISPVELKSTAQITDVVIVFDESEPRLPHLLPIYRGLLAALE